MPSLYLRALALAYCKSQSYQIACKVHEVLQGLVLRHDKHCAGKPSGMFTDEKANQTTLLQHRFPPDSIPRSPLSQLLRPDPSIQRHRLVLRHKNVLSILPHFHLFQWLHLQSFISVVWFRSSLLAMKADWDYLHPNAGQAISGLPGLPLQIRWWISLYLYPLPCSKKHTEFKHTRPLQKYALWTPLPPPIWRS